MPGRRYTQSDRAKAVGLAIATNDRHAADQTGIPRGTIRHWVGHPEFAALKAATKEHLADELWATIQVAVSEVAKALVDPEASLRDKVVALGILYDKHALLTGSATSRSESRDITGTISDAELRDIVREAERLASGERSPAPPAPATEG